MNWYKIAQDKQLNLFEKEEVPQISKEELPKFVNGFKYDGGFFVVIKASEKYYAYSVGFEDNISKARYLMEKNPGRGIDWLEKNSSQQFEVTKNYPAYGSIIRNIKENKNDTV